MVRRAGGERLRFFKGFLLSLSSYLVSVHLLLEPLVREMGIERRHIFRCPKTTGEEKDEGRSSFEFVHTRIEGKSGESAE